MRVFITGAEGQVGEALIEVAPNEHDIEPVSRTVLDLSDLPGIEETISREKPDCLINAAAYTDVEAAENESELAMMVNGHAPIVMAKAMARHGGKMVHISSDYVFDGKANQPYRPTDPVNPLSSYGRSKLKGEEAVNHGATVVRTSWVYSAGHRNFVTTILRLLKEQGDLKIVGDQFGSPTWARSLAHFIWSVIGQQRDGIVHFCDGAAISWHDFAVAIAEEALSLGLVAKIPTISSVPSSQYKTKAERPGYSVLDIDAEGERQNWRENLREMLRQEQRFA